jgi:YVTN family beta-propeller protein
VAAQRLITHLPISVRPDQFCLNRDRGQLFVTGEGMDAVVVIYHYNTPQVGDTVLAGHATGAMDVSEDLLFVASPLSGDVSVLSIATRKVIAVVPVGSDPGFIRVTANDQYALVLNRKSGDVAILSVPAITKKKNRYKTAALLTVIPVGSRPVSAVVRAV